jgi:hypothetical protein
VIDFNLQGEKDFAKDIKEGIVNYVTCDLIHSNSHLKEKIAPLLGKDFTEIPWSEEELELSLQNIRKTAQGYLNKAQEKLNTLKKIIQPNTQEAHASFAALESLLFFLSQRNV